MGKEGAAGSRGSGKRRDGCGDTQRGSSLNQIKQNFSKSPPGINMIICTQTSRIVCSCYKFKDFIWACVNTNKHFSGERLHEEGRKVLMDVCTH